MIPPTPQNTKVQRYSLREKLINDNPDTPRTNAVIGHGNFVHSVDADFARGLEREINSRKQGFDACQDNGICGVCDGSGEIDAHEDDPNWYQPGEVKPCPQCGGTGK